MTQHRVKLEDVLSCANAMWRRGRNKERAIQGEERKFRCFFGCGVVTAYNLWCLLEKFDLVPQSACLQHMLWVLMFMKVYGNEDTMSALAGVDAKTFRKHTKSIAEAISYLEPMVVSCCVNDEYIPDYLLF